MSVSTDKANRGRGMKAALGAFGVVLLAAVPALGLTTLGSDFFPTGQASEESAGAQVSNGPFTFDAPLVSMRRVHPSEARDARAALAGRDEAAVVLEDWRFTQNPISTFNVLAGDILKSFETFPLFWAYVATQIPGLYGTVHDYLDSLTPIQRDALLLYAFILLFNNGGPSPIPPSPVSGNK